MPSVMREPKHETLTLDELRDTWCLLNELILDGTETDLVALARMKQHRYSIERRIWMLMHPPVDVRRVQAA